MDLIEGIEEEGSLRLSFDGYKRGFTKIDLIFCLNAIYNGSLLPDIKEVLLH